MNEDEAVVRPSRRVRHDVADSVRVMAMSLTASVTLALALALAARAL